MPERNKLKEREREQEEREKLAATSPLDDTTIASPLLPASSFTPSRMYRLLPSPASPLWSPPSTLTSLWPSSLPGALFVTLLCGHPFPSPFSLLFFRCTLPCCYTYPSDPLPPTLLYYLLNSCRRVSDHVLRWILQLLEHMVLHRGLAPTT
jgi:hypothetical protein